MGFSCDARALSLNVRRVLGKIRQISGFWQWTSTTTALPAEVGGYGIARFNALRHGVLSRYTVLPWEDEGDISRPA